MKESFYIWERIANEKNIEALLRSWRQTKTQNCKLVIVGGWTNEANT